MFDLIGDIHGHTDALGTLELVRGMVEQDSAIALPGIPINASAKSKTNYYREDEKPVFFGHYWLKGNPTLYPDKICCLDYSVPSHGFLCSLVYISSQRILRSLF